jgi:hypothetical protein
MPPSAADIFHGWVAVAAWFVLETEDASAALIASGGSRNVGVAMKALAGGTKASLWFWCKKAGYTAQSFDQVFAMAREEMDVAAKEVSGG